MIANKNVDIIYQQTDPMEWLKRINDGIQCGKYNGVKGAHVRVVPNYIKKRGYGSKG